MFDQHLIYLSQVISLVICLPVYFGFLIYAYWRPNKERIEALALIPFEDEGAQP
ncbi:MAG TPA: cbb3-type cytochrome c oxidase subunit 3 [Oscillatoriaceae cyanobacterium]